MYHFSKFIEHFYDIYFEFFSVGFLRFILFLSSSHISLFLFFFFFFFFISSEFCHTLKWKGLGFTYLIPFDKKALNDRFSVMEFPPPNTTWWLNWERTCLHCGRPGFELWIGKIPWRRYRLSTLVFLPGEFHRQRSLAGYSPWACKELDTTKRLKHTHSAACGPLNTAPLPIWPEVSVSG